MNAENIMVSDPFEKLEVLVELFTVCFSNHSIATSYEARVVLDLVDSVSTGLQTLMGRTSYLTDEVCFFTSRAGRLFEQARVNVKVLMVFADGFKFGSVSKILPAPCLVR